MTPDDLANFPPSWGVLSILNTRVPIGNSFNGKMFPTTTGPFLAWRNSSPSKTPSGGSHKPLTPSWYFILATGAPRPGE